MYSVGYAAVLPSVCEHALLRCLTAGPVQEVHVDAGLLYWTQDCLLDAALLIAMLLPANRLFVHLVLWLLCDKTLTIDAVARQHTCWCQYWPLSE